MAVDQYNIPTLETVATYQRAPFTQDHQRLESILGRKVTVAELMSLKSMESEHASYASTGPILRARLPVNGFNHLAGIGAEAAVAVIGWDSIRQMPIVVIYSSESHNWPSWIHPYAGAGTAVGGILRDQVAENGTNSSCILEARRQSHPLHNPHKDPVLIHTEETTRGIADYGNAMGVPHMFGSIKYHTGFSGNNLVNGMALTIATADRLLSNKVPDVADPSKYVAIYVGKATDATGLGGTIGASQAIDMTKTSLIEAGVQDPDPHMEEAVFRGMDLLISRALQQQWKVMPVVKDMGAAGLLCSTAEPHRQGQGIIINGDLVPQNEQLPSETLLNSETQERMMIIVHEDYAQETMDIFNKDLGLDYVNKGACARVIGRFNDSGKYIFVRNGIVDVDLPVHDLAHAPPTPKEIRAPASRSQPLPYDQGTLAEKISSVLSSLNFKSDHFVFRHYDQHVQSTNIVQRGQAAAPLRTHDLLRDDLEVKLGYSAVFDSNPAYGILDPSMQAQDAFVRGAFAMALVGCSVIGVTNNANYGRTNVPEEMWEFDQGQDGVAKACINWKLEQHYIDTIKDIPQIKERMEKDPRRHVTVNSGNVSVNKANANTGTAIPPTTILGLVGWTDRPYTYATWDIKPEESTLFLIGNRQAALGGTDYLQSRFGPDCVGDRLFDIYYAQANNDVAAIIASVRSGLILSGNNIEEGGLCNAIAEMVSHAKGEVSVSVDMDAAMGENALTLEQKLFAQSHGVVLQVATQDAASFLKIMQEQGAVAYPIGEVAPSKSNVLAFASDSESVRAQNEDIKRIYFSKLEQSLQGKEVQLEAMV